MFENKNKNLTSLEDLGEFNLIDLLTKDLNCLLYTSDAADE